MKITDGQEPSEIVVKIIANATRKIMDEMDEVPGVGEALKARVAEIYLLVENGEASVNDFCWITGALVIMDAYLAEKVRERKARVDE